DTTEEMLGDTTEEPDWANDPALASQTLNAKPIWQKLLIIGAGPAMNMLLPVLVIAGTLMAGIDRAAPGGGTVERGSRAESAGIQPGDRIASVGGKAVHWWDEVESAVREHPSGHLALAIEHPAADGAAQAREVELDVQSRPGLDVYRDTRDVGWLGIQHP